MILQAANDLRTKVQDKRLQQCYKMASQLRYSPCSMISLITMYCSYFLSLLVILLLSLVLTQQVVKAWGGGRVLENSVS